MARNAMEQEARCQAPSGVERIRFFPAHLVMNRRQHKSGSIHKSRGIMLILKSIVVVVVVFSH